MNTQEQLIADGLQRITDAAKFLGISRSLVYRLINSGALPTVRIGRTRRIPIRAVLELAATSVVRVETPLD